MRDRASRAAPTSSSGTRSPAHGMRVRREGHDLERLGRRRRGAADDPRLEHDRHDRRLEPRVQPDDLARLDDAARSPRASRGWPPGGRSRRPRGSRPAAPTSPRPGLDAAAQQDELAGVGDRQRRHHEPRIDVGDVAARRAGQPVAVLAGDRRRTQRRAAARADSSASGAIQRGTPPTRGECRVERPSGPRVVIDHRGRVRPAARRSSAPISATQPDHADDDPGQPEQALPAVDRHPRPGRAPDADDRVSGGQRRAAGRR